ncbi:MAG: MBL fold metallo-hydrolase [Bacteroidia bacterium]|nr:MBL fold metallo-hydrolase [Bacteroidia bacterium]
MKKHFRIHLFIVLFAFPLVLRPSSFELFVLGTAQDGGRPHTGCVKTCCTNVNERDYVVSLALADHVSKKWWLFEATPDIREQLELFQTLTEKKFNYLPDGIFITHAHIGHYTGLMQFGREVMNTKDLPVYVLPKMAQFLRTNGPWSQLDSLKNISITEMKEDSAISPVAGFRIKAWMVPHRDEFSETAGFSFCFDTTDVLFIPDIDKWEKWDQDIVKMVKEHDHALLDATFYDANELPGRDIKTIPHPLVSETMTLFKDESAATKAKVVFIHFNHTNLLLRDAKERAKVLKAGFRIAGQAGKIL